MTEKMELAPEAKQYLRSWERQNVRIPADVEILLRSGRTHTKGTAIVRNISYRGALIGKLTLRKQTLPAKWFRIRVRFRADDYKGIGALCRPVRFGQEDEFELAVEFEDFWARADGRTTTRIRKTRKKT